MVRLALERSESGGQTLRPGTVLLCTAPARRAFRPNFRRESRGKKGLPGLSATVCSSKLRAASSRTRLVGPEQDFPGAEGGLTGAYCRRVAEYVAFQDGKVGPAHFPQRQARSFQHHGSARVPDRGSCAVSSNQNRRACASTAEGSSGGRESASGRARNQVNCRLA